MMNDLVQKMSRSYFKAQKRSQARYLKFLFHFLIDIYYLSVVAAGLFVSSTFVFYVSLRCVFHPYLMNA